MPDKGNLSPALASILLNKTGIPDELENLKNKYIAYRDAHPWVGRVEESIFGDRSGKYIAPSVADNPLMFVTAGAPAFKGSGFKKINNLSDLGKTVNGVDASKNVMRGKRPRMQKNATETPKPTKVVIVDANAAAKEADAAAARAYEIKSNKIDLEKQLNRRAAEGVNTPGWQVSAMKYGVEINPKTSTPPPEGLGLRPYQTGTRNGKVLMWENEPLVDWMRINDPKVGGHSSVNVAQKPLSSAANYYEATYPHITREGIVAPQASLDMLGEGLEKLKALMRGENLIPTKPVLPVKPIEFKVNKIELPPVKRLSGKAEADAAKMAAFEDMRAAGEPIFTDRFTVGGKGAWDRNGNLQPIPYNSNRAYTTRGFMRGVDLQPYLGDLHFEPLNAEPIVSIPKSIAKHDPLDDMIWVIGDGPSPFKPMWKSGGILSGKSGIHIKKENRGKFTKSAKAAGEGVQEHAHKVMNDPHATTLQKRRANFAIQAARWSRKKKKHAKGGIIPNWFFYDK